jgi:hypothetical protein
LPQADFINLRWAQFLLFAYGEDLRRMKASLSRSIKIGTLVAGAALLWSCVAPILTVPPPSQISFSSALVADASGAQQTVWTTQGGALPQAAQATYYVFDRTLGAGVIATAHADGSFTAPAMAGTANDPILVYYKTPDGDYSDSICVLLSAGTSPPLCPE